MAGSAAQRVAILGGSFDPPHLGHEHAAIAAVRALDLDELFIIPAALSPHKSGHRESPLQRFEMSRLMGSAIVHLLEAGDSLCKVSVLNVEIQRQGTSYSWLTLQELKEIRPKAQFFLIIGDDNLAGFSRWKRWQWILENANLAVVPRFSGQSDVRQLPSSLDDYANSVHFIGSPRLPAESSVIREMIGRGESVEEFLNPDVYDYIRANSIYMV